MKKTFAIIALLAAFGIKNCVHAQSWQYTDKIKYEMAKKIKDSKFIVVLFDKMEDLNDSLKKAMKKYWTFCDYEYATQEEANDYANQDGYTLLMILSQSSDGITYGFSYSVAMGAKKNAKYNNIGQVFCSTILPSSSTGKQVYFFGQKNSPKDVNLFNFDYMIQYVVKKSNDDLVQCYESKGKEVKVAKEDKYGFYRGGAALMAKSKILICEDGVPDKAYAVKVIGKMTKHDESNLEVVSRLAINKAIAKQEPDVAVYVGYSRGDFEIFYVDGLIPLFICGASPFIKNVYNKK